MRMRIIERLLKEVRGRDTEIKGAWIGLHWTAVWSMHVGMAHTYKTGRKMQVEHAGHLSELSAWHLAKMSRSGEPLNASVGVAALNSLIEPNGRAGSVNPFMERYAKDRVVTIIGRFPFNNKIAKRAKKAYVLEFEPKEGEMPSSACEEVMPRSEMNIITATALINHTLDRLLELGSGGLNIVLGPSTPMTQVMFDFGVDILAGVRVSDPQALSGAITQGVKEFKKIRGIEPLCLSRDEV
ncbi:MAG: DUF364 domain-containing protein [Candidatus Thermoplasmatota archaeon]